ncbi:MAG: NADP-dependent oxidoreductase [Acidobacteriia bacterium]|nr:NADP-dependent oxidoreductase [Terriglobia bacterium]
MRINKQWRLAARPQQLFKDTDFKWIEEPVPALADGQVLVRNVYLSLDPTNRVWASQDSYMPMVPLGEVMRGGTIGVVEESRDAGFAPADIVQGLLGWQLYASAPGAQLTKLPKGVPLTAFMGLLGHIGLTAYFGLIDIGQPKEGETLVVSAAAGAVGSLVGQIGKIKGCYVVGIAGSDEKCRWLKDELGYDAAINYRKEKILDALKRECPRGIDIYFDNVGGEILDAALALLNLRARIPLCGMISQYTATGPVAGPSNLARLIMTRSRIEGFLVTDYLPRAGEAIPQLLGWMQSGKLKFKVDVAEGLESAPRAINKLFEGTNTGKLVVKISEEP